MWLTEKALTHRTWNEAHFFQALVLVNLHVLGRRGPVSQRILSALQLSSSFSLRIFNTAHGFLVLPRAFPRDVNLRHVGVTDFPFGASGP